MRLIDADKLMELYENPPDLSIDNYSVPISVIRQNIMDMSTINPYEWISINDKLPERNQEVLTCSGGFIGNLINVYTYMGDDRWEDSYGYWNSAEGEGITHWMPLSKLPDVKENCDEKEI